MQLVAASPQCCGKVVVLTAFSHMDPAFHDSASIAATLPDRSDAADNEILCVDPIAILVNVAQARMSAVNNQGWLAVLNRGLGAWLELTAGNLTELQGHATSVALRIGCLTDLCHATRRMTGASLGFR